MGLIFMSQFKLIFVIIPTFMIITIYMEGVKGGTPGKLIMGMRIVNSDGKTIGIPKAILRNIGKMISSIILGIGYFMIGWDKKKARTA